MSLPLPPGLVAEGELGRGAFARVLRVRDGEGRVRAAKAVPRGDDAAVARLAREARALSRVSHEGVVRSFGLVEGEATVALLLELVEGSSFVDHARRALPPPPAEGVRRNLPMAFGIALTEEGASAYRYCGDAGAAFLEASLPALCAAVSAIHAAGFLHLDLHPENVRVTSGGRVVVLDLGLAVETGPDGVAAAPPDGLVGLAPYLAPELGERPPSRASDWYSVGVLLFEALTGAVPFEGAGADVLVRKRALSPPEPSSLVGPVPADLERTCLALLDPLPSLRGAGPSPPAAPTPPR